MMITSNLSIKAAAIRSRIQRLPRLIGKYPEYRAKKSAEWTIQVFHDGIKKDALGLMPLAESTIDSKEAAGYEYPESPLYALGDEADDTYANMLEAAKIGDRKWIIRPRKGYHQKRRADGTIVRSKLTLKRLFKIHEYGATINNGRAIIRLAPRPALHIAFRRVLKMMARQEPSAEVRKAMAAFVRAGNDHFLKELTKRAE